ncbi:hypothetical protein D030_1327B, partial [Vibrio parahaemolyticus AQ3810]
TIKVLLVNVLHKLRA